MNNLKRFGLLTLVVIFLGYFTNRIFTTIVPIETNQPVVTSELNFTIKDEQIADDQVYMTVQAQNTSNTPQTMSFTQFHLVNGEERIQLNAQVLSNLQPLLHKTIHPRETVTFDLIFDATDNSHDLEIKHNNHTIIVN